MVVFGGLAHQQQRDSSSVQKNGSCARVTSNNDGDMHETVGDSEESGGECGGSKTSLKHSDTSFEGGDNKRIGMKVNVPKTVSNPLCTLSRREFQKMYEKMHENGLSIQFRSIDDHVSKILETVAHLVDDTYETYGNMARCSLNHLPIFVSTHPACQFLVDKHTATHPLVPTPLTNFVIGYTRKIQQDTLSSTAGVGAKTNNVPPPVVDAAVLSSALAEARRIKEEEKTLRAQYVVLDVSHKRQKDLYAQLHKCAQVVSDECVATGNSTVATQTLAGILKQCIPSREARVTKPGEEVIDRIADQLADLHVVEEQYKMMLAEIDRLYGVIRDLKEKSVSKPSCGPPVTIFPNTSLPKSGKRQKM